MTGPRPRTSRKLIDLLRKLNSTKDARRRQFLLQEGRKSLLNWFGMGATNMINGSMPMTKPTEKFVKRHFDILRAIADRNTDPEVKRRLILKRGGAGFLGGVIIRNMMQWPQRDNRRKGLYRVRNKNPLENPPVRRGARGSPPPPKRKKKKTPAKRRKTPKPKRQRTPQPVRQKTPPIMSAAARMALDAANRNFGTHVPSYDTAFRKPTVPSLKLRREKGSSWVAV